MSSKANFQSSGYRSEINGLRAIAVLLVIIYHSNSWLFPGGFIGVDVFFVISGYLISGLIIREIMNTGTFKPSWFFARRYRRLLPAASLVIVVISLASIFIYPASLLQKVGQDGLFASLQIANINFMIRDFDYLSGEFNTSPFLNFWSLSVEEQFYLLWPIVAIIILGKTFRTIRNKPTKTLFGFAFLFIFLASFAYAQAVVHSQPIIAFYSLPTRAWELALGGMAYAFQIQAVKNLTAYQWLKLTSLLIIVLSALFINKDMAYPSFWTLIPTIATAAFLYFSVDGSNNLKILSTRPMTNIGNWSYSLYLWHWPILVIMWALLPSELPVSFYLIATITTLLLVFLISWGTYSFVENPIRRNRILSKSREKTFGVVSLFSFCAVIVSLSVALGYLKPFTPKIEAIQISVNEINLPADLPLGLSAEFVPQNIVPSLLNAEEDVPEIYRNGCHEDYSSIKLDDCKFGDIDSKKEIWLIGDSHSAQWFPVIDEIAKDAGYALISHTKSACPLVSAERLSVPNTTTLGYESCESWQTELKQMIEYSKPEIVITSGSMDLLSKDWPGFRQALSFLNQHSGKVIVLGDTPRHSKNVPACLEQNLTNPRNCLVSEKQSGIKTANLAMKKAAISTSSLFVDTASWFCVNELCPVVVGPILMYRDKSHLTTTAVLKYKDVLSESLGVKHESR